MSTLDRTPLLPKQNSTTSLLTNVKWGGLAFLSFAGLGASLYGMYVTFPFRSHQTQSIAVFVTSIISGFTTSVCSAWTIYKWKQANKTISLEEIADRLRTIHAMINPEEDLSKEQDILLLLNSISKNLEGELVLKDELLKAVEDLKARLAELNSQVSTLKKENEDLESRTNEPKSPEVIDTEELMKRAQALLSRSRGNTPHSSPSKPLANSRTPKSPIN